ncbi:unnamed protein product [Effrenium voratum]|nr:unnamed protein product [Effrenium voratum]|mmetsp:Transcript_116653/g.277304  ORF Transcript_116653/g.277304 Transcript_116653/m.277304 type:complete len:330 (+) Transcript_116653:34-1023(+)
MKRLCLAFPFSAWAAMCPSMLQSGLTRGHAQVTEDASFERAMLELVETQKEMEAQLRIADVNDTTEDSEDAQVLKSASDALNATYNALNGTAAVVSNIAGNVSSGVTAAVGFVRNETLADHSFEAYLVYWFGPDGHWVCVPTLFFSPRCGYFHAWLTPTAMYCICLLPYVFVAAVFYYWTSIDTRSPDFDDDWWKELHGWSLKTWQFTLMIHFAILLLLPMELFILYKTGFLQVALQAMEPYVVGLIVLLTLLSPCLSTICGKLGRCWVRVDKAFRMLENVHKTMVGNFDEFKDKLMEQEAVIQERMQSCYTCGTCGTQTGPQRSGASH